MTPKETPRIFEKFPQDGKTTCPICNTHEDKPCFLIPIDGTQKENICEAAVTHVDCIYKNIDKLQYERTYGVIYMRVPLP
jgi:uncharacterized Zn finger protein (UPF0148 family)